MEKENRVMPRILFNSPIQYHKKGSQEYNNTVAKDVSNSGISFISNEFLPKYSQLVFDIQPPWQPEPIQTLAEVVWVSNQPHSERFNIGAKFSSPLNFAPPLL